jgi:hypothetical protein
MGRIDNPEGESVCENEDRKPYRGPAMAVVGTVGELTGGPTLKIAGQYGFHD